MADVVMATLEFSVGTCEAEVENYGLSIELDEELNCGKTCFKAGDTVTVRVYKDAPNGNLDVNYCSTIGTVFSSGDGNEEIDEFVVMDEYEASASKPMYNATITVFQGSSQCPGSELRGPMIWENGRTTITAFPENNECTPEEEELILPIVLHLQYQTNYDLVGVIVQLPEQVTEATALIMAYSIVEE